MASNCGFTKQYSDLQKLWETYKEDGLIVLGIPSNQFGGQEPGTNDEIKKFCEVNFNVNFPMTDKVDVKGEKCPSNICMGQGKLWQICCSKMEFS